MKDIRDRDALAVHCRSLRVISRTDCTDSKFGNRKYINKRRGRKCQQTNERRLKILMIAMDSQSSNASEVPDEIICYQDEQFVDEKTSVNDLY